MKHPRRLHKRRRRESKTNYRKRLILLKSNSPRLVVRKTNKYIILQIAESEHAQDKVLKTITTKELLKFGWPKEKIGSLKSLSASYLAGLLIGKKVKIKKAILDSGLIPNTKGSRVYAIVKGARDAGLNIPCNEKVFPDNEKIQRYDFFDKVKNEIEKVK